MNRDDTRTLSIVLSLALIAFSGGCASRTNYLNARPALARDGLVNVVIEIPAGTSDKWEVEKSDGSLAWEYKNGKPRVVQYLAYPGNYGMIPRTSLPEHLGGDGDPLDVLLLGPRLARGTIIAVRPVGVLRLLDDGERDDKIIAIAASGPLSDVTDLVALDSKYPGVTEIIEIWFTHYKGPDRISSTGFGTAAEARSVVGEASRYYQEAHPTGR